MRLSPIERTVIRDTAKAVFGQNTQVRLFGSRLDDSQRGGDIDLLIETPLTDPQAVAAARTLFLAKLYAVLGEQKIDILVDWQGKTDYPPIYALARQQGVVL